MKDFDIKIEKSSVVKVFGTEDNTIVIPADAKIDPSRSKFDITLGANAAKFGIPHDSEKIEIAAEGSDITVENVSFERLEIDAKGTIIVKLDGTEGPVDINMAGGEATLIVKEGFSFRTEVKGKNNKIDCSLEEDPTSNNIIELNGKDSILNVVRV